MLLFIVRMFTVSSFSGWVYLTSVIISSERRTLSPSVGVDYIVPGFDSRRQLQKKYLFSFLINTS